MELSVWFLLASLSDPGNLRYAGGAGPLCTLLLSGGSEGCAVRVHGRVLSALRNASRFTPGQEFQANLLTRV